MRLYRILGFVFTAIFMVCCSGGPVPPAQRRAAPPERVADPALLTPTSDRTAQLTFTRDHNYVAMGVGVQVFIDGKVTAKLAVGETISVYVRPGRHILGARFSHGNPPPTEREFVADSQRPLSIRVTYDTDLNLDLKPESGFLY
jgi:hypothetical protein